MLTGKFTIKTYAEKNNLTRQSAINKLSKLKKQGYLSVTGGGKQPRIYTIKKLPSKPANGFYNIVNKHSKEKLVPKFKHRVVGNYTIEHAIIDGINIGDKRTLEATAQLFNQVKNWKRLFDLAKKHDKVEETKNLYKKARNKYKVRKIPKKYQDD